MNLIISQERSLNKACGFLNAFKHECILVIDRLPVTGTKEYINLASKIVISPTFDINEIISAVPACATIWCVSENLLPIVATLESWYNIHNISPRAATVLSDKAEFDNFCREIGYGDMVPRSIIPRTVDEILNFSTKRVIVKSNKGSGGAVFFPNDNQNNPSFEFKAWENPIALVNYLTQHNLIEQVLNINHHGVLKKGYACPAQFMIQEFCEPTLPCVVTSGFVRDGKVEIVLLGEMVKAPDTFNFEQSVIENHCPVASMTRDSAIWTIGQGVISTAQYTKIHNFLQAVIDNLQIKTLFFSGPDFHIDQHNDMVAIDFNPRISGWLNLINARLNGQLIPDILNNVHTHFSNLDKVYLWGCVVLRPGTIKKVNDISAISKFLNSENTPLIPGTIIPPAINLQNKQFNVNVTIESKNLEDLHRTYREVTQILQMAIEYC